MFNCKTFEQAALAMSYLLLIPANLMWCVFDDRLTDTGKGSTVPYQPKDTLSAFLFNPQLYEVWVTRSKPNIPFVVTISLTFRCWKIYLTLRLCVYSVCPVLQSAVYGNWNDFELHNIPCTAYEMCRVPNCTYPQRKAHTSHEPVESGQSSQYTIVKKKNKNILNLY